MQTHIRAVATQPGHTDLSPPSELFLAHSFCAGRGVRLPAPGTIALAQDSSDTGKHNVAVQVSSFLASGLFLSRRLCVRVVDLSTSPSPPPPRWIELLGWHFPRAQPAPSPSIPELPQPCPQLQAPAPATYCPTVPKILVPLPHTKG